MSKKKMIWIIIIAIILLILSLVNCILWPAESYGGAVHITPEQKARLEKLNNEMGL